MLASYLSLIPDWRSILRKVPIGMSFFLDEELLLAPFSMDAGTECVNRIDRLYTNRLFVAF